MKLTPFFFNVFLFLSVLVSQMDTYAQGWQWGRGNTGGGMDGWPVATDPSGNVFVAGIDFSQYATTAGAIFGNISVPFSNGSNNGFQSIIAKYNANGNCLWAKGTENGDTWLINIATDQNGNSFLFGSMLSRNLKIGSITLSNSIFPSAQYFLVKFDPSGNVVWAKNGGNTHNNIAVVCNNKAYVLGSGGISTDASGNVFITANFNLPSIHIGSYTLNNADPTGNSDDIFVAKYDPAGNVVWATSSGGNKSDDAYGLTVTPAGAIYIVGVFSSSTMHFGTSIISNASGAQDNAFIAKYNSSGTPEWASGSGGQGGEFAVGIASDASGNIYLTGGLIDNSISFSGTTITNPYPGNVVLYLVKFDTQYTVSWFKTIGCPSGGNAWGYCIAISACGAIWVSGSFFEPVSIDGHMLNLPPGSVDPVFIAGFSSKGVYAGSAALQSGADDQNGIACDTRGNVYMCADYNDASPFVIGPDTLADIKKSNQVELLFLAKYTFVDAVTPDTFTAHSNTEICPVSGTMLYAPPGFSGYLWNNGDTGDSISINKAGEYWVLGEGTCNIIDSISVTEDKALCPCNVYIPNTFTPNNDGLNDYFHPLFDPLCIITDYYFIIVNRWGQQVFKSSDLSAKWDGKFLGVPAEMGTYMYYLKYKSGVNNTERSIKGDVTLVK